MSVTPYQDSNESKKRQVELMFDNISAKYDFLNHSLSLNLDRFWRNRAIALLRNESIVSLLDVATGTGDMIKPALRLKPQRIVGLDLSEGMLQVARRKFPSEINGCSIEFMKGDSENMPFKNATFDAVTVAFGVRNFENPVAGLTEISRVLRPGGRIVVLEFSKPRLFPFRQLYNFYFRNILPIAGRLISKDKSAYTYLPESVNQFPEREAFMELLRESGFRNGFFKPLTLGVATLYTAVK